MEENQFASGYKARRRCEFYSAENIRQLLDMRNFMDTLRSSVETGGPPAFNHADRQSFANQLNRFIAARRKAT